MRNNPPWTRDELILALELYSRVGARIDTHHPEVTNLSQILRGLPLHTEVPRTSRYRSPSSVHLKLRNFIAIDPGYPGKGLPHGGGAERHIWEEFADNRLLLSGLAQAIREGASAPENAFDNAEEGEKVFPEGRILYRAHRSRERNISLVKKAKAAWTEMYGGLKCQACGFDFGVAYGSLGEGYIECHHNVPVSDLRPGSRTRLRDLTPVCANCHRMLHRKRPWTSVEELSNIVRRVTDDGSGSRTATR